MGKGGKIVLVQGGVKDLGERRESAPCPIYEYQLKATQ